MSGLIDANLLGTAFGDDIPQYGAFTNRNNVRKMVFDAVSTSPKTGGNRQLKLNQHQRNWRGFDTPAALLNLTDGIIVDGSDKPKQNLRWSGVDIDESSVGSNDVSRLSSYSYSVLHKEDGSGRQKVLCTSANIQAQPEFSRILGGANLADVTRALEDYESTGVAPQGVNYPSVKNVPMFNEIGVRIGLVKTGDGTDGDGVEYSTYDLQVLVKAEFWYPFFLEGELFRLQLTVGADRNDDGNANVWVQIQGRDSANSPIALIANGSGSSFNVRTSPNDIYFADGVNSDDEIEIRVPLLQEDNNNAQLPRNMMLRVGAVRFNSLELSYGDNPVDSTPQDDKFVHHFRPAPSLSDGDKTEEFPSWEVSDPRLNHDTDRWDKTGPTWGAINNANTAAKSKVAGLPPGQYLYCRNGPIEYPGELGYLSNGRPWETLDIFSDDGIQLMNRLICDQDMYDIVNGKGAFFTNGTINPYTRYPEVLNAAFYGLDMREVPGMAGDPDDDARLSAGDIENMVEAMMEEPLKDGQAGWARVLNSTAAIPDEINKNNRIAILNNTWGLFNESDRLFVVAVVAQSIKESDEPSGKGNWDPDEDMITGERRAVALGWLDGSADVGGETLAQEMNIVAFQYLNE
jgi:hypothetical protein